MLFSLIGKQMKMLLRNKQPLIILLVMPVVLITILSTALASVMNSEEEAAIQAKFVLIDESSWEQEEASIKRFLEEEGVSGPALEALLQVFKGNDPIHILEESIFGSEDISKYISKENRQFAELDILRKDKEIDGILLIPADFRFNYIKSAYFDEQETPDMDLFLSQENGIRASIIQSVLDEWQTGFTKSLALTKVGISADEVMLNGQAVERIEQSLQGSERKIPASIYYTVGMLVMFALYIPTFLAGFALQEVQWKVYDRILLAGVPATLYAFSIFITGMIIALMQQVIILLYGKFVLGIDWIGLEGMALIALSYSLFIGGLSALLTTLQLRTKSEGVANIFSGLVVSIFAFLGGSFFNIGDVSSLLANIGSFTPNGATMSAILAIQKGQLLEVIWFYMFTLYGWFVICILLSIVLFPKRGVTS
ncbi:ABC transporter permease [Psychrobacillus lasiicapitis]|uniref:ABC transporter permease n=1 Tax=Psychrobacillus lasiicapitis TaxID=1636719 RepID=A0A544T5C4_9BACI|nr:ABC transporter permease [Psychrobacillus lasiicapitis]TQR12654.1 ABC transporter permease [Psychrobacillus lasiicapitis]GGA39862.1 permease [Psychrobacillus lasiicapitis]